MVAWTACAAFTAAGSTLGDCLVCLLIVLTSLMSASLSPQLSSVNHIPGRSPNARFRLGSRYGRQHLEVLAEVRHDEVDQHGPTLVAQVLAHVLRQLLLLGLDPLYER